MHVFKDKDGVEWQISMDLSIAMKIDGFDFAEALDKESPYHIHFMDSDDEMFQLYLTNTRVCFTMVWLCCEEQAKQRGYNDMLQFGRIFNGQAWDDARMALMEELPDFFPRRATTLRVLTRKYSEVMAAQDKTMAEAIEQSVSTEKLNEMGRKVQDELREEMDRVAGK